MVAENSQPASIADNRIELVAMHNQKATTIRSLVDRLADDADATEFRVQVAAHQLVMVSGNIDDPGPRQRLAEKRLDHLMVQSVPVATALKPPAIDDVADQVEVLAFRAAQEIEKHCCLASARP